jgi:hypothetical protein
LIAPHYSEDTPGLTKALLQSANMALVNPEYAKWWSANESGIIIHLDSDEDSGSSSTFWDNDAGDHHREDATSPLSRTDTSVDLGLL